MEPALLISVVSTAVAVIGSAFGVITYSKNQTLKRQEILFPLINEFENDKNIKYATNLLDSVPIDYKNEAGEIQGTYDETHIAFLDSNEQTDKDVITIKRIFDKYLNFFGKLGYLIDTHVLSKHDVSYFDYYIMRARDDNHIMTYAVDTRYDLFLVLLDKTGYIELEEPLGGNKKTETRLKNKVTEILKTYYKRNRYKLW